MSDDEQFFDTPELTRLVKMLILFFEQNNISQVAGLAAMTSLSKSLIARGFTVQIFEVKAEGN